MNDIDIIERPASALTERPEIAGLLAKMLHYDPETGVITFRAGAGKNRPAGARAGYRMKSGYVLLSVNEKRFYAHRIAWLLTFGEWPEQIDHINGDKADNRIANLRSVTRSMNMQNLRRAMRASSSGLLGVTFDKRRQKFVAQIVVAKRHVHIGQFDCKYAAHKAYVTAKRQFHKGGTL